MHDFSETEGIYRSLFDHVGAAIIVLERASEIAMMNDEAIELTGYSQEELRGKILWDYFVNAAERCPTFLPETPNLCQTVRSCEGQLICRTGEVKHVLIKITFLPKRSNIIVCLTDISHMQEIDRAIEEKKENYRNILQNIDEGYFEVDIAGNMTFCNDSLCRITGYSREELLGMSNRQYTKPETAERMYRIFNQVYLTGRSAEATDYEIIRKDGGTCFFSISASLMRNPEGNPTGFCGVVRDISEKKKNDIALEESENKFRHLVRHAPAGIFEVDFLRRKFITVNEVMCEYTGYTREELLSLSPLDILSEESRERFIERLSKVFAGEKVPEAVEYRIKGKNEREFWVVLYTRYKYENGMPCGATVIVHDITERRQAEEALRKSEERYRLLVDNASEGIFIEQDDVIKFPNPKALEISGYSAEELTAMGLTELFHPEDISIIQAFHEHKVPKTEQNTTLRLMNKRGEEIWLEVNVVPVIWESAPAFLHLFKDVTLQKKLEAQLMHAQKMEAIGTLAGGIAHNFNNLLMAIQGNVSLMLLDMEPKNPHADRLNLVEKLIESGSKLTRQLLGYARGGKHEFRPVDINRLTEETSQTLGLTKKEIMIHLDLSPDLIHIMADRAQIEEVLMNIFINAADAMPKGGNLFVTTRNVTEQALWGKPFKMEPGNYALIEVRDTGSGMDQKTISRIFDPFFTTKPPGRGTGLGLASVYGIVKCHNGYIDASSKEGAGACFSIYLPLSQSREGYRAHAPAKPIRGAETLLLVDDEESVLKVAQMMLEKLGYRVIATKSSEEAIELFSKNKTCIDLAILDMVMPDMGGGLLYEKLKMIDPDVKALLSSGYSVEGEAMEILRKGCNDFIQKPFGLTDLSKKVRGILDSNPTDPGCPCPS
ncbi:MAG: PAS domain S-box protein [Deltaproteobacteria bacterium]|nr:PAS domain S-box protein [Deltaproteobacteria bacterium]